MSRQKMLTFETEGEIFPTKLRELMKEHAVNQSQLGTLLGVKRQTISLYMTGQSNPDWKQV